MAPEPTSPCSKSIWNSSPAASPGCRRGDTYAGSCERPALDSPPSPVITGHHHVYLPAAAFRADQPLPPLRNGHLSAVPFGLLGGIRFDLMPTLSSPYDQANAGSRRTA